MLDSHAARAEPLRLQTACANQPVHPLPGEVQHARSLHGQHPAGWHVVAPRETRPTVLATRCSRIRLDAPHLGAEWVALRLQSAGRDELVDTLPADLEHRRSLDHGDPALVLPVSG